MQEHQVTAAGVRYPLEEPFFVLATQNPIEMEGTYPLPEAQLDRFMFNVIVDYLPEDDEVAVVQQTTSRQARADRAAVRRRGRARSSTRSSARCRSPRTWSATPSGWPRRAGPGPEAPELHQRLGELGRRPAGRRSRWCWGRRPGPCSRGRFHVAPEDIRALVHPTLRHRILLGYRAEADGVTVDAVIDRLLEHVKGPARLMPALDRHRAPDGHGPPTPRGRGVARSIRRP